MLEGKLFWGSPPRRRRATAPRSASAGRLGDGVFLRKIKAGAGAHAMLDGKQFFQKAQPGIARVRAARAAPRCRACACEGSEAWRADTLVFASIEPARTPDSSKAARNQADSGAFLFVYYVKSSS